MKFFLILTLLASPLASGTLQGATLWQDVNMYTPAPSLNTGDTVTVIVEDVSRLRYNLDVEHTNSSSVNSSPDTTITAFLPAVNSNKDITHNDGVKVESRGNLSMRIAALVGARQNDGTFVINGSRTYVFNGVANTIAVTGRINPVYIDGSAVQSDSIVNFQMTINTTTQGLNMNLDRQLEADDTATSELTEEEKQQIITDYLKRMIDELSK